jgi:hypothetical protein
VETAIKALKRMTNTAVSKSQALVQLWDICLELQCLIQLSITHNIYVLNNNVHLDPVDFPEDKRKLGCWRETREITVT